METIDAMHHIQSLIQSFNFVWTMRIENLGNKEDLTILLNLTLELYDASVTDQTQSIKANGIIRTNCIHCNFEICRSIFYSFGLRNSLTA